MRVAEEPRPLSARTRWSLLLLPSSMMKDLRVYVCECMLVCMCLCVCMCRCAQRQARVSLLLAVICIDFPVLIEHKELHGCVYESLHASRCVWLCLHERGNYIKTTDLEFPILLHDFKFPLFTNVECHLVAL